MAIEFIGVFIDEGDVEKLKSLEYRTPLSIEPEYLYVTFQNEPENPDPSLYGKSVEMKVTGYGCTGRNEGFLVELHPDDEALKEKAELIPTPVITMSYHDSDPKKTRLIPFYTVDPFIIRGTFGVLKDGKPVFK